MYIQTAQFAKIFLHTVHLQHGSTFHIWYTCSFSCTWSPFGKHVYFIILHSLAFDYLTIIVLVMSVMYIFVSLCIYWCIC